ncbi:MAG: hypothetical protein CVU56_05315 [Deltaproteobacteria bacterium HGW-Deltaproteobacteria-14]|jgi:hypothetical protein|nr:MAG: hypothetical protein CVU56_05315 [Deltaproteobacteria bacterium HGW-Deltaproteobacteria-14]
MSVDAADGAIALTAAAHLELQRLTQAVAHKRLELENAQLRAEVAFRRVLDELGLSGRDVRVDLDRGTVIVHQRADAAENSA